ncbi:MAG: phenylalanine--tRNA ligase subunit beta [Candidatus Saccharimonadales bacterium]
MERWQKMKVSLSWAQYYSDVDIRSLPTDDLVKLATERLGGVESYEDLSKHYEGIVVAKVVSCNKHPNADKLNICKVDDGGVVKDVERDDNGLVQVVCGAPNAREGILVAWIPPSAIVPASYGEKELFVLEARDLRGELSNGMLASPRELGISDDHAGILEIDEDIKPGTQFKDLYSLDDVIIDIENKMFTHRPDGFGQLGVARELAGIQHKQFKSPDWYNTDIQPSAIEASDILKVKNETGELCPRYTAVVIDNIEVKPSPIWLQSYLKRVGVRPVNNVVDITNYMMMLTAQPLHAFDFDKIAKDGEVEITVRKPTEDEKITLLGGREIEPHNEAVLICSKDGPIALGGVMGGANSEVDADTKRIVLECATFDMYNIRKTSMIHGIFTDAVTRFNKGQPAAQLPAVMSKAISMFQELIGSKPTSQIVDTNPDPVRNCPVEVLVQFINDRLGSSFDAEEITKLLTNVEFEVEQIDGGLKVTAPFWRTDIELSEDIVEEVGRLYGFNQLPTDLPKRDISPIKPDQKLALKQKVREILSRAGANEVLTYSFVHGDLLNKVGQKTEDSYALRNALSPDLQYYRQSLTPSLLDLVHGNIKSGYDEFALFELNKAHNKIHGNDGDGLPGELDFITLVFTSKNQKNAAYFNARRYLDYLASSLELTLVYSPINKEPGFPVTSSFDHERSALVTIKETDTFLGIVGEYKHDVIRQLKLPTATAGFELGLEGLQQALIENTKTSYRSLSKYPSATQDICYKLSQQISFGQIDECLRGELAKTNYAWELYPIDIFSKTEEFKNITFRLQLSDNNRTLKTSEVNTLIESLSQKVSQELDGEHI